MSTNHRIRHVARLIGLALTAGGTAAAVLLQAPFVAAQLQEPPNSTVYFNTTGAAQASECNTCTQTGNVTYCVPTTNPDTTKYGLCACGVPQTGTTCTSVNVQCGTKTDCTDGSTFGQCVSQNTYCSFGGVVGG